MLIEVNKNENNYLVTPNVTPPSTTFDIFSDEPKLYAFGYGMQYAGGGSQLLFDENGNNLDSFDVSTLYTFIKLGTGGNSLVYTKSATNPLNWGWTSGESPMIDLHTNVTAFFVQDEILYATIDGDDNYLDEVPNNESLIQVSLSQLLLNNRGS